jgi:hypothetical protein
MLYVKRPFIIFSFQQILLDKYGARVWKVPIWVKIAPVTVY